MTERKITTKNNVRCAPVVGVRVVASVSLGRGVLNDNVVIGLVSGIIAKGGMSNASSLSMETDSDLVKS